LQNDYVLEIQAVILGKLAAEENRLKGFSDVPGAEGRGNSAGIYRTTRKAKRSIIHIKMLRTASNICSNQMYLKRRLKYEFQRSEQRFWMIRNQREIGY
jgi:hypothetical protein